MAVEHSGTGDPARSMALLWRSADREGRTGLSVDRIVTAAIEIADGDGLANLSMRRVAERLGVGAMSLYTYVPGKGELLDLMIDQVLGETERPEPAPEWRARLEQVARANLALYRRHPWLLQIGTSRPPMGPNLIAKYDYELGALEGAGLSDVDMDTALTSVLAYVSGAAQTAVEFAQAPDRSGMTDDQWWAVQAPLLEKVFDPERFPVAARVGAAAGEAYGLVDADHAFEFGLRRLLDGIEAYLRRG
ncbi:TetR/AcrR family transcriptional regulator [Asanoa sp. WMMD1127]|uniref:TetR/AcrR family transcriptional regulator n=1 Tax=Asanoa sp. WMMD1127 TaxID=3016107 RepID=UPI0024161FD3|nr:TetR/AcrR family transcriptional regulator [Asanoa sp. WMMD1127]MDG4826118.1 TetR/AcrR family transcriptional regulator [Asanoa sp. WMMD1127]